MPTKTNTIQYYMEASLYTFPSIFGSRFDVLEHLFATNGNGVGLTEQGLLEFSHSHPSEIQHPEKAAEERFRKIREACNLGPNPSRITQQVEEALDWENRAQITTPVKALLYPWTTNERFQPFRQYVACTCPDIKQMASEFSQAVMNISAEDAEAFCISQKYRSIDYYVQCLKDWQQNISVFNEAFSL